MSDEAKGRYEGLTVITDLQCLSRAFVKHLLKTTIDGAKYDTVSVCASFYSRSTIKSSGMLNIKIQFYHDNKRRLGRFNFLHGFRFSTQTM